MRPTPQPTEKRPAPAVAPKTTAVMKNLGTPSISQSMRMPNSRCHHSANGRPKRSSGTAW